MSGGAVTCASRADAPVTEAERVARAALTRLTEPGDAVMGAWTRAAGPVAVWRSVRAGRPPATLSARRWAGVRLRAEDTDPERDLAAAAELGIRFVCPGDTEWPTQIDDLGATRPPGLWVRGTPSLRLLALRSVAVVGARACTDYGGYLATELSAGLAERGWTVVSGAAYGIDGAAHHGALRARGTTVGVLASGVDRCYPAGHRELLARIAAQGVLVSELAPGGHPTRHRFLQRNRMLAALTRGTVVVEAASRSGALSTARHASRLGRQAMGVPGPVYSSLSEGVHQLLRGEAALVTRADEIIELVGRMGELAPTPASQLTARDLLPMRTARVLEAIPGPQAPPGAAETCGGLTARDIASRACTSEEDAAARLCELRALGLAEHQGDYWRLASAVPDGSPDTPVSGGDMHQ